jgi:hypothetical protein
MMKTQREDLEVGLRSEKVLHPRIAALVGEPLTLLGGCSIMDYANTSKTIYAELKTRNISSTRYPTAMVGKNKVEFCNDPTKNYYFVFCYTDGVFYIKYDKALFANFREENDFMRGERADCVNRPQRIVHIPREQLTAF